MSFIAELKRRSVFKVSAAYLVVAWLAIQVAATVAPQLDFPDWVPRLITFVLLLGFPVTLVLAWMFERTPEGVRVDARGAGGKWMFGIAALLVAAVVVWYWKGNSSRDSDAADARTVAVLPFANLSGDPEQEYFSDGMTEELLNVLARLPELKVAARTSVFEFKGKGGDVREIGQRLGVSHIVEGSVRREGEHVRVTAQLVRVADGFHVWSESYDRELEGVFALQDDIARHIAEQLESRLGVGDMPAARSAIDPLAYDEYLKGRTLYRQRKDLPAAIAHLQAAVTRAPEFGAGWASLSLAHEAALWYTTPEQRAMLGHALANMRAAAERAAGVDPEAALTLHAQANVARGETRYAEAERLYVRALQADPTYPDVREDYAELLNSMGRPEDSLIAARQLVELDPFAAVFWLKIALIGQLEDRRELVDEARARMRAIDPTYRSGVLADFYLEFWQGRIEAARTALAEAVRFAPDVAAQDAELFRWSEHDASVDNAAARLALIGRRGSPADSAAVRPFAAYAYAAHRGDTDLYFALWDDEAIHYNFYFQLAMPIARPLFADPRAKEMLKRYGFVAYWREKGWPSLCRPLGDDDFECGPAAGND